MEETWTEDQEVIHDFLLECEENLARMDQELETLRAHPRDEALLGNIFRTIHTIKGASGLLAFPKLVSITLPAEILLGKVRDGKKALDPDLTVEAVVAIRSVLASIERGGDEGTQQFEDLIERLKAAGDQA